MQAINQWLHSNLSQHVTQFQVSSLLSEVYSEVASTSNAANVFQITGLWPAGLSVLSADCFIPSGNLNTLNGILEVHVAVAQHRLEQMSRRKNKAVPLALKIYITLQMSQ